MALENWGQMTKAQDDDTSIDTAIANAIAVHEADPESHMGAGESIENHRVNEVIDHPQGSVVGDKTSVNQLQLLTNFESSNGWTLNGTTNFYGFSGFMLENANQNGDPTYAWFENGVPVLCSDFNKNLMFQAVFSLYGSATGWHELNFCLLGDITGYLGLGFRIDGLLLKGVFNDGVNLTTKNLLTLSKNITYVVRAFANQATGNVEFWLNGNLIDTIPFVQNYTSDESMSPLFQLQRTGTSGTLGLFLNQLLITRDI